jgi:hypothetical protein
MFDPVSLAILGGSTVAGGVSGLMKNNTAAANRVGEINYLMAQRKQDAEAARVRNRVLGDYLTRQDGWVAQNQGDFDTGIAGFMPGVQATQQAGLEGARGSSIDAALGAPNTGGVAMRAGAPNFISAEIDKKVGEARDLARDSGMKLARMGSYGDTWGQNNRAINETGQKIDTTNTIAKGNASLIPYAQDLAEFQVRSPIAPPVTQSNPWYTSILDGAAKLGSAYAGSKMGGGTSSTGIWAGL